jgi:2-oxoglutarate ferredoxin oxidoreductase subunit delta
MNAVQARVQTPVRPVTRPRIIPFPKLAPVKVNSAWCKGCDICSALCPKNVLKPGYDGKPIVAQPQECTQCGMCWMHCPDFAITSNFR